MPTETTRDWIVIAIGVVGVVSGLCGAWVARRAVSKADKANRVAEDANRLATGANELSAESNLIAREASQIARAHGAQQEQMHQESKQARLVLHKNDGRELWVYTCNSNRGAAVINLRVRNDGAADAKDIRMDVFENGEQKFVEHSRAASLPANVKPREFCFFVPWNAERRPPSDSVFAMRFRYSDQTGEGEMVRCFQFSGDACPKWTARAIACPE